MTLHFCLEIIISILLVSLYSVAFFFPANLLADPIQINDETPLARMMSQQTGTRVQAFRDAVRS